MGWVGEVRLSANTKTFPALLPSRGRAEGGGGGGGRQVRRVEELARSPRRTVLNLREPANVWDSFPRPLIFSDHAVVAGLRLGGSQGKMPTLLLGCFVPPRPHRRLFFFFATFLQVTKELWYYGEYVFRADGFPTLKPRQRLQSGLHVASRFVLRIQVHVSTREDHQRGSCGPASQTKTPWMFPFCFYEVPFFCVWTVLHVLRQP